MPQDFLPAVPAQGRAGGLGGAEAGSFRKVLQERQSSSEAAPDQAGRQTSSSSRRVFTARSPASHKQAEDQDAAEATGDGNYLRNSRTEGALSEDSLPQLDDREEDKPDEAIVENAQEVAEPAISVAGNAVVVVADAAPKVTVANVVPEEMPEEMPEHEGAAAPGAVGSAGADIEAGTILDSGVGAAGTAVSVKDRAAAVAVTGGANAAEKAGETAVKTAGTVSEKPAQQLGAKEESKGATTEARSNSGSIASEKTHPDVPRLQKMTVDGASGRDEASARLEAAAGIAAADPNVTNAAVEQNQDDWAQVDHEIPPEQSEAGEQVQGQKGGLDLRSATATTQEPSSAADAHKETKGVAVSDPAAKAEPKEAGLKGGNRLHPPPEAVEQGAAGPGRSVEATEGGKTSSVVEAQGTIAPVKAGEDSGNAAGKGGEEQQQGKQAEQLTTPPLGAELRAPDVTSGATKSEAERTTLHRSILSQVKDGAVTHDSKGNGQMNIKLNPAELGELNIQVRMEDGRVRVDVQAENRMVKDLLMSNLDTLKEALAGRNFTMEGFEVSTGGGFNNAHPEQRANPQQRSVRRVPGSGYAEADGSEVRVNYLTTDVNNLLDVRF
jgi:flagellar hook-length control protein FliK